MELEHELTNGGNRSVIVIQTTASPDAANCAAIVLLKKSGRGGDKGEVKCHVGGTVKESERRLEEGLKGQSSLDLHDLQSSEEDEETAYNLRCLACTRRECELGDHNGPLGELSMGLDDESLESGKRTAVPMLHSRKMGVNIQSPWTLTAQQSVTKFLPR